MKRVSIVLALVLLLSVGVQGQYSYQSGNGVGVFSQTSHVLLAFSDVGRSVDIEVKFQQPFEEQPRVALAAAMIEMEAGAPSGYTTELVYVNEQGFKIRAQALSEKKIMSLSYNWLATSDPRIHVEYVRTRDMGELSNSQAEGMREHSISVPIVHWNGESPTAMSFLMGVEFEQGGESLSFKQQVIEVGQHDFRILMESSPGSATVKNAKFCVVFSSQEHSYLTGEQGLKAKKDHPWLTRESGESKVDVQFDLPQELKPGSRVHLEGITGFDVAGDVRVVVNDLEEQDGIVKAHYGTWGDSKLRELNYQAFFFSSEQNRIFDKECAEVFSECNFLGNNAKLCESTSHNLNDLAFSVKSVHVPEGSSVSLFNLQGLKGQKVKFTESVECLDMNAILLGEDSEEGVDLYEQEEYVAFSEEGSEYSGYSVGEEDSEFSSGEDSSSSSSSDGEGYDLSESSEEGLEAVEMMNVFLGEEDSVEYEESSSYSSQSGEESDSAYDSEESGESSYSSESSYDVSESSEEGLEAAEMMNVFLGEEDSLDYEESSSYSTESGEESDSAYSYDSEESGESSYSSDSSSGESSYDVDGEEFDSVEQMHVFLGEEDSLSFSEESDSGYDFSEEEGSTSYDDSSEESSSYSSYSEESSYDVEEEEQGVSVSEVE